MNPESPIPDLPLKEYSPAGFPALSYWQRVARKVYWGHRASYRRAWVDETATAEGEPVLITSEVDSWHCSADANLIFNASKPSMDILAEHSDLGVEIIDDGRSQARVFRWNAAELKFEIRAFALGKHLYEILAVSRGLPARSVHLDDHLARARGNLESANEPQRYSCIQALWRFLFSLVLCFIVAGVPAIIVGSVIGAALGLGSLTGLVVFFAFIAGSYLYVLWANRRQRKYLDEHWSRVFRQGDHDGTVRRALASIGIELPAPNTQA